MRIQHIITLVLVLGSVKVYAQDPIFTQSNYIQETLNPGFSGFEDSDRIAAGLLTRTQWPNLDLRIDTQYAYLNKSFDYGPSLGFGLGINFLRQHETFNKYNYYQINVNYMHRVNLNDGWFFRPAIEVGLGFKDIGFSNLTLADQININTGVVNPNSVDPLSNNADNVFFGDISAGIVVEREELNNVTYWFGVSAKHLNRPNISFVDGEKLPLDIFYSVHGNFRFPFLNDYKIMMTANYMQQGEYNRLDIGSLFTVNQFLVGVTAATNPAKNDDSSHLLTSINAFVGLEYEAFRFGLSYDANTTNIGRTNGVYEFSLTYLSRCRNCKVDRRRKR
ncbi:PorP/SprF family type IX secretion system membrane protein [Winogradskyella sp. SYSU M77433]|uniref:PorP/SprF family type IX secretion system membrane protein n=1 Tax=Winogradskyella sp. SYSU M77433 TaxID=3042722 RepID=UPI00248165E9|nr:PorP/SprF family type IX secretion system membrane protein [Winogradskyella sp. SYSU M77433]MDH7914247.1 PorP/SprF family type IX secretion system membrane protein [Winogradskyella sp. SYSU M77433]